MGPFLVAVLLSFSFVTMRAAQATGGEIEITFFIIFEILLAVVTVLVAYDMCAPNRTVHPRPLSRAQLEKQLLAAVSRALQS